MERHARLRYSGRKRPRPRRKLPLRKRRFELETDGETDVYRQPFSGNYPRPLYGAPSQSEENEGHQEFHKAAEDSVFDKGLRERSPSTNVDITSPNHEPGGILRISDHQQSVSRTLFPDVREEYSGNCDGHVRFNRERDLNISPVNELSGVHNYLEYADRDWDCAEDRTEEHDCDISQDEVEETVNKRSINSWQRMIAVLAVTGTNRLTKEQFLFFRNTVNWILERFAPQESLLPSYSTLKRTVLPYLEKESYASSETHSFDIDLGKAGAKKRRDDTGEGNSASAQVVLPSEWAKRDVSFKPTWDLLKNGCRAEGRDGNGVGKFLTVCESPMVSERNSVLEAANHSVFQNQLGGDASKAFLNTCSLVQIILDSALHPGRGHGVLNRTELTPVSSTSSRFSIMATIGETQLVTSFKTSVGQQNSEGKFGTELDGIQNLWRAGDICTTLKVDTSFAFRYFLIHRFGGGFRSGYHMELACIPCSKGDDGTIQLEYEDGYTQLVRDVIRVDEQQFGGINVEREGIEYEDLHEHVTHREPNHFCQCKRSAGLLQKDLRRYFVYRVLLFSDGFSQYKEKQGSAGGIYMLPLNFLPRDRKSRKAVRLLSLTPPGVSTSQVLRFIADDLKSAATEGIDTIDGDGLPITIFIQLVAYVGDYLEVAHISDVMGHSARSPCTLCVFRSQNMDPRNSSYGYTTDIHSADSSSFRSGPRAISVREAALNSKEKGDFLNFLGMDAHLSPKYKDSPLFLLHRTMRDLEKDGKVPLGSCGHPILNPTFDPYRSVLVAPDHLLAGNAINLLTTLFLLLPTKGALLDVDAKICHALRCNGLVSQQKIFDTKNKKLFSTSLSGTFCILLMAEAIFFDTYNELTKGSSREGNETLDLLQKGVQMLRSFTTLVSRTYWYPKCHVDGPDALQFYNRDHGARLIGEQQERAKKYVENCNALCRLSATAKSHMDKPNLHRLIELYAHSIPAMGHVHHFAELIFEFAHQPLKRGIARSNGREPQLQAINHALADDWQDRLSSLVIHYNREGKEKVSYRNLYVALRMFLNGSNGCQPPHSAGSNDIPSESAAHAEVSQILIEPVLFKLCSELPKASWHEDVECFWELHRKKARDSTTDALLRTLEKAVLKSCRAKREVTFFGSARRFKQGSTQGTIARPSSRELINVGHAIQVLVRSTIETGILLHQPSNFERILSPEFNVNIFTVLGLLSWEDESELTDTVRSGPYAFVRKCETNRDGTLEVGPSSPLSLIHLDEGVRRVGLVHACSKSRASGPECCVTNSRTVTHNESLLSGGRFYFYKRSMGYPPRMA